MVVAICCCVGCGAVGNRSGARMADVGSGGAGRASGGCGLDRPRVAGSVRAGRHQDTAGGSAGGVSGGHGRLPRVRDVGLDQLRVHAARVQVPYIERDQQDKLEEAVGPGQAVLVVGHSMSGKTRLAAEVIKRKFPDALLLSGSPARRCGSCSMEDWTQLASWSGWMIWSGSSEWTG